MHCDRAYFRDISRLTPAENAAYVGATGGNAAYTFQTFKADVIKSLKAKFGNDVDTSHKKAIKISANGNRRSADVLVCQDFRRYLKYTGSRRLCHGCRLSHYGRHANRELPEDPFRKSHS
jgi:hypothetical protein